jgi:hypothetical protein
MNKPPRLLKLQMVFQMRLRSMLGPMSIPTLAAHLKKNGCNLQALYNLKITKTAAKKTAKHTSRNVSCREHANTGIIHSISYM